MASAFIDAVKFSANAGGTGDFGIGAGVAGYRNLTNAGGVTGATYSYRAESADLSQWEIGLGVYTSGVEILSRATVLYNSLGTTAKISFTNPPTVGLVALSQDLLAFAAAQTLTATQKAQARANISAGSFSAHKNGVDQTGIASATDTKITFSTKLFDPDGCFDNVTNYRWTPPAGKVLLTAQVWVSGTFVAGGTTNLKIFKNGSFFKGAFQIPSSTADGTAGMAVIDNANGTDYYELYISQATSSGTVIVRGTATWTYFMGTVL